MTDTIQEVIYTDGSTSTFTEGGGSQHVGGTAINRLRLKTCKMALECKLNRGMELTRGGSQSAMYIIAQETGKTYKRSRKGKEEALADVIALIDQIENNAVIYEEDKA